MCGGVFFFFPPPSTGGNKLQTTGVKMDESKVEAAKSVQSSLGTPTQENKNETPDPLSPQSALAALQSDVQPVGHDYVEEVQWLIEKPSCTLTYSQNTGYLL